MKDKVPEAAEFIKLLKKMFRVDESDLDFGIYRVLNAKRREINQFIEHELPSLIDLVMKDLREAVDSETINDLETSLYQHLMRFFSRYFDNGDFMSLRRFSKKYQYVIPYNGEEICFHWVNADQYFVKTTENLVNYRFFVDDKLSVAFRVMHTTMEKGNVKSPEKKYFLLSDPPFSLKNAHLDVYFEHRPLTAEDLLQLNLKGTERHLQQKILERTHDQLVSHLATISQKSVKQLIEYKSDASGKTLLYVHMLRFFRKSTSDYFIHKNLKAFLLRELDHYLKSEVLELDRIINVQSSDASRNAFFDEEVIFLARLIKKIAVPLIELLHQVEDYQKTLWEKKKFVIETHYVITLNILSELAGESFLMEILDEIMENDAQRLEWKELLGETISSVEDLKEKNGKTWKSLPLDTRHFSNEFKWHLLTTLSRGLRDDESLDDYIDGVLIKSENWQALNFLLARYREKVKLIYIDPPFNKEQEADYLYKVRYKDATWLTLLENRLRLAKKMLSQDGSIFVRCDYNGNMYVRMLLNRVFGKENFRNEIIVKRGSPKAGLFNQFESVKSIGVTYDNLYWYSKYPDTRYQGFWKVLSERRKGYWSSFRKIYDRPTMRYELLGIKLEKGMWKKERALRAVNNYQKYLEESKKTGETLDEYSRRTGIRDFIRRKGNAVQYYVHSKDVVMLDNNWLDIPGYSSSWGFKTENSEVLLKRVIEAITDPGNYVMDFFLGSGTTIAVAQKLGRKWIGIEMGDHFWDVILPRMKKVLHHDKTGVSRDPHVKKIYNKDTTGGFFKYLILEQYEDALENVTFNEDLRPRERARTSDYTIKYLLFHESRKSPSCLNVEALKNPFTYELRVIEGGTVIQKCVDVMETFIYLLGLQVSKYLLVRVTEDQKDSWIVVLGNDRKGRNTCIIWRPIKDQMDFKKDAELVQRMINEFEPDVTYINGDCAVPGVTSIEPVFKALMFKKIL